MKLFSSNLGEDPGAFFGTPEERCESNLEFSAVAGIKKLYVRPSTIFCKNNGCVSEELFRLWNMVV